MSGAGVRFVFGPPMKTSLRLLDPPLLQPSGFPALDEALGGGLPAGRLVEIVSEARHGGGAVSFALALAEGLLESSPEKILLVLQARTSPQYDQLLPTGDWFRRTAILRPPAENALALLDEVLRSPAVCAAIAELPPRSLRDSQRLAYAARRGGGTALLLCDRTPRASAAAVRLKIVRQRFEQGTQRFEVEVLRARGAPSGGRTTVTI